MNTLNKIRISLLLLVLTAVFVLFPMQQAEAAETNVITIAKKNSVTSGEWTETAKGIRYKKATGTYLKNKWVTIEGKVYYFNTAGYAAAGWFTYQGKHYYAGTKGIVYVSKWKTTGNKKYYLKSNGVRAARTWVKIGGSYYYFGTGGVMAVKCQVTTKGKTYYVGADGARKTKCWITQAGKRYYFNSDGVRCESKWVKYKGNYYYLRKNGVMATERWIDGTYYVGSDGARKTSCYVDGYYLDENGKKTTGISFAGKYLFVGDSRIVGMNSAVSTSETKFIGKVSMGYSWLRDTAGPEVKKYLQGNQNLTVVFAFGINDLGNIGSYISYYQSLMSAYPSAKFCFISVNPVNESTASAYGYSVKNSSIKSFNAKLKAAFPSQYLNTYSYLTKNSFSTLDGIHYTSATYQKLYQYVVSQLAAA